MEEKGHILVRFDGVINVKKITPEDMDYYPVFDKAQLDLLIEKASPNLSKIKDVDKWMEYLREG